MDTILRDELKSYYTLAYCAMRSGMPSVLERTQEAIAKTYAKLGETP